MSNTAKKFIPIAFLPYEEGYHYIVKTPQEEPEYYYCLYPTYELTHISVMEAQDALIAHDYRKLVYDEDAIKKEKLSSVLESLDPEEA